MNFLKNKLTFPHIIEIFTTKGSFMPPPSILNSLIQGQELFMEQLIQNHLQQGFLPIIPFVVKNQDIEPLPEETQKIGDPYIQEKDIQNILKKTFNDKIKTALSKPLTVYNNKGITLQDITDVIEQSDKETDLLVQKYFNEYKKLSSQLFEKKATNLMQVNKEAYDKLNLLIEEYEQK